MSRHILLALIGAVFWLGSTASMANINAECSANNAHGYEVCPYIKISRQEMAEYGRPPAPFVNTQIGHLEEPNFGTPPVQEKDATTESFQERLWN